MMLLTGLLAAQYNQKGMVHLAIGGAIGAHATELEQRFTILGVTVTDTETDGAATTSVPIQIGYAIGNRFSLGLLIEPGRYVPDSANSDQTNSFINVAIEPRFYIVNANRIAWHASLQLGGVGLRIQDDTPNRVVDARYSGGAFGLGTGVAFGLGESIGLGFDLRYLATNMKLRAMEINDSSVTDIYDATLRTGGMIAQISLAFRFGAAQAN
ncbi:MAG: hypothetical protein IPM46_16385 [Flavobacteriales bacterium]|nr:hypothetical protein [Flavobacteriales bacterium]